MLIQLNYKIQNLGDTNDSFKPFDIVVADKDLIHLLKNLVNEQGFKRLCSNPFNFTVIH